MNRYKMIISAVLLLISHLTFPVTLKYNTGENLVDVIDQRNVNEEQLKQLFDSIRRHNNKFVQYFLATDENIERVKKSMESVTRKKEGSYDVVDGALMALGGNIVELIDVNARSQDGYTPIIVAIEAKNNDILKLLIENGADLYERHPVFNRTTVGTAAYYGNAEAVEILLQKDSRLANIGSTVDGWTPLEDATLKSNPQIVKLLLKYGANPTITDKNGGTPMDMATKFGKGEIVKLLRDHIKANRN